MKTVLPTFALVIYQALSKAIKRLEDDMSYLILQITVTLTQSPCPQVISEGKGLSQVEFVRATQLTPSFPVSIIGHYLEQRDHVHHTHDTEDSSLDRNDSMADANLTNGQLTHLVEAPD